MNLFKNNNNNENNSIRNFIIKTTLMTTFFSMLLTKPCSRFLNEFTNLFIESFFSIDLDEKGNPDLKDLEKYNIVLGNIKFPMGRVLISFLKLLFNLIFVYIIACFIIYCTDLINLN
jgi:hypothetical protein